jgi:putative transposase
MDGRGAWKDNAFVEGLWRSIKCEAVYPQDIADGFAAQCIINEWMHFCNRERPASALGKATPEEAYGATNELRKAPFLKARDIP